MYPDPRGTRLVLEEGGLFLRWPKDEIDGMDLRGFRKAWASVTTPNFPFHPQQVVVLDTDDREMLDADGTVVWRNRYLPGHSDFERSSNQPPRRATRKRAATPPGTPRLPSIESVPLVRTDFSDDTEWATICGQVTRPWYVLGATSSARTWNRSTIPRSQDWQQHNSSNWYARTHLG